MEIAKLMKQQISISLFNNKKEYLNALPKQDIFNHYINNMIPPKYLMKVLFIIKVQSILSTKVY